MATNTEVLQALNGEVASLTMSQLAEKMGVKPNQINTILRRLCDRGLVSKDGENCYIITDDGLAEVNPATMEGENLTPQKIFEDYGRTIGISSSQLPLISDYVFKGGKYDDLKWVFTALGDMNVPKDKLDIWWNKWRVYCKKPVPMDMPEIETPNSRNVAKDEKQSELARAAEEKIEWDIGADDIPVNVGEMAGRMTHPEAMEIARYRAMRSARAAALPAAGPAAEPVDPVAQLEKTIEMVKKHFTENHDAKPLVVVPQEDGTIQLQELDYSKPISIGGTRTPVVAPPQWVVDRSTGEVRELKPGEPVVIGAPAGNGDHAVVKSWIVHDSDGSVEEYIPGKPIVIKAATPVVERRGESGTTPMMINAQTPDGKPFVIDIESAFKWDDHMTKKRHDEESHEMKQDIGRGIKDLITKGVKALDNMTPDEEGGA